MLYADPNDSERRVTVDALEDDTEFAVEGVATAAAVRDTLTDDSSEYACLVTAYWLRRTNALSLFDTLRSANVGAVPVVLYTDDGDETLASDAITAGLSGYVPKGRADSVDRLREQLRTVVDDRTNTAFEKRETAGGERKTAGEGWKTAGGATATVALERERDLEQYRTLVEAVGDSMYLLDADGRIEMANDAMIDSLGGSRESLIGSDVTEFVAPEDAERIVALLEEIRTTDGQTWGTIEITVTLPDGESCMAELNVAPLVDDDGRLTGSAGVLRNIAARKERERQIRHLHDGTRRLMAATEADAIAEIVTEIATDALEFSLNSVHLYREDILTRSAAEGPEGAATDGADPTGAGESNTESGGLVPVSMSDRAADLFGDISYIEPGGGIAWDAYEAGEAIVHGDVRRSPNVRNSETSVRSEAHIPLGEHGILILSSLAVNDFDPEALTLARILAANAETALDRAQRERELAARSRELERQNDRLETFARTVSHDLRNPLTLASGHLELLESAVEGDGTDHLEEIEWALERMDELIENVLTLAKSGQQLTETEPIELRTVVERAHRTVDSDLPVHTDGPLPTVEADESRLRVLFENAFRNARDHAGEDVTVSVARTNDGFAIDDDGPGIPPAEREAVLESGYSTATDGTGFGLAIISEVVDAHGWSLDLAESPSGGLRLAVSVEPHRETTAVQTGDERSG